MKKTFVTLLSFFVLAIFSPGFAQETAQEDTTNQDSPVFSWTHNHKWHHHAFNHWNFDFDSFGQGKPTLQFAFGKTENKLDGLITPLNKIGNAQVRLGYVNAPALKDSESVLRYSNHYAEISFIQDDLWKDNTIGDLKTESLRFGLGWEHGYGYSFGKSALYLTNSFGVNWNRLRVKDFVYYPADIRTLNYYDDEFKFGVSHESAVRLQLIPSLSLDAAYDKSVIFERVLFWKLSGSLLTEAVADALINHFVDEIMSSSPYAGPIVSFLLKSGVSYGFAELRKENMNAPFGGDSPLMQATYKFGVTFNF